MVIFIFQWICLSKQRMPFLSKSLRLIGMLTLPRFYKNTEIRQFIILMTSISYSIFHWNCSLKKSNSLSLCTPHRFLWLYLLATVSLCFWLGCEKLLVEKGHARVSVEYKVILCSSHCPVWDIQWLRPSSKAESKKE